MPKSLPRTLGRFDALMMIAGNIIGVGIFTTTGFYAAYIDSPFSLLFIWLLGGVYAFCGALTYAELSTRFPHSGGDYLFLTHAYHPLIGFLFGWSTFTITYTGSAAVIALGFGQYLVRLLPVGWSAWHLPLFGLAGGLSVAKTAAVLVCVILTAINSFGLRQGSRFQNVFTVLGLGALAGIILLGITSPKGDWSHFQPFFPESVNGGLLSGWGVALIGVIFAYTGWTVLVYIAGEIRAPGRNIPLAMGGAVLVVTMLYLLTNVIYLYARTPAEMSGEVEIGYQTMKVLIGENTGALFSGIILLVILSSLNSTLLSGARIYFAMAREGRFFSRIGNIHFRYRTPFNSLWLQCGVVLLMILIGDFEGLLTFTVSVIVLFSLLAGIALFVFRYRYPAAADVYRTWGYPWIPLLYIGMSGWIFGNTVLQRPLESLWGALIVCSGIPFYLWWELRLGRFFRKNDTDGKS